MSLALASNMVLAAAAPTVGVVMVRREGITKKQAGEIAAQCITTLAKAGVPVAVAPIDGLACKAKRPCLISQARAAGLETAVLLEIASVLQDGLAKAEVVSIEADGRKLATAEWNGDLEKSPDFTEFFAKLLEPLRDGPPAESKPAPVELKPAPVDVTPARVEVRPTPVEVKPPPSDLQQPVTLAPTPASGLSTASTVGLVVLGVGVAAAVAAGVFWGLSSGELARVNELCPIRNQCFRPEATEAFRQASTYQGVAIGMTVGGGAALVGGLVLFLAGRPKPVSSMWIAPRPGGFALGGVW